jgi:hypothetical protein
MLRSHLTGTRIAALSISRPGLNVISCDGEPAVGAARKFTRQCGSGSCHTASVVGTASPRGTVDRSANEAADECLLPRPSTCACDVLKAFKLPRALLAGAARAVTYRGAHVAFWGIVAPRVTPLSQQLCYRVPFDRLRRTRPASAAKPVPSSTNDAGSGVAETTLTVSEPELSS